jgi:hypothetical protein
MDLSKIIHIQGTSGLQKVISQSDKVVIAESLIDKKRMPVTNGYGVIQLDMVTVYSHRDEDGIGMSEIFKAIHDRAATEPLPDKKAIDLAFKDYFRACVPDYDEARVYASTIKKILSWYTLLKDTGFSFEDTPEEIANKEADSDTSSTD